MAPIEDKMRENGVMWFGHVYHGSVDAVVRSYMVTVDGSSKGRGRLKLTLEAVVQKDLGFSHALDRAQ